MVVAVPRRRFASLLTALGGWPRRAAATICLALALVSLLTSQPAAPPGHRSPVVIASRALRPGTVLSAADLAAQLWPDAAVPAAAIGRLADAVGHAVGAAMTRGEPVTAARLLDTGIASALDPGQVALTIRLASPDQAAILQAGALIDLYRGGDGATMIDGNQVQTSRSGQRLASNVRVLAVVPSTSDTDGPSIVVAADQPTATRLTDRPAGPLLASLVPPK